MIGNYKTNEVDKAYFIPASKFLDYSDYGRTDCKSALARKPHYKLLNKTR